MPSYNIKVNGKSLSVEAEANTPLLWILRDELKMKGTKFGCGIGQCGACTVHLNGNAARSCSLPISSISNADIVTIEGLSEDGSHPVQVAWMEENVPQCGYCQAGQMMSASAFLSKVENPSEEDVHQWMSGNICRCGTYPRIKKAIFRAAKKGVTE
ncbi:(2Fe-2S)-binding protein [Roseivirga sp. E12]|uniref:(2Fe-2S)-binding protein n=1 Tax=Roseivirga sp. E12 TaxID=2819237 RepID=UPI001ABCF537|nr:(2Fe-2S)-binding protein [Roseivirga sp. E12]MBO3696905.1 (2Fe-2S)-binding protein [Roseivirga sp. E12]